jgi:RNA recognition motif-containing protein
MNIYISNLHDAVGDHELKELFVPFGEVRSAQVVKDFISGKSRGFGYVEMEDDTAAQNAISHLHKTELETLTILVEETKLTEENGASRDLPENPVVFNKL